MFGLLRRLFQQQVSEIRIQHPELGLLKLDGSLWAGVVVREGRDIPFRIAGTRLGPNEGLVATLQELIQKFSERESMARAFIASHDSLIDAEDFTVCSIVILWPKHPECYYFEYRMVGDEYGMWRVEFEGVEPKYLARDD